MKKRKHTGPDRQQFNNNPFTSLKRLAPASSPPIPAKRTAPKTGPEDPDLFLRAMSGTRRLNEEPGEETATIRGAASVPKQSEEAEQEEFLRAMAGTRRIDRESSPQALAASLLVERPKQGEDNAGEERKLFIHAVRQLGPVTRQPDPEDTLGGERRSSSGRMKQLRRGAIRISSELDLHGSLRDEALVKLRNFIAAAYNRAQKAVLVITGKGINSPEGPVLQGAVAQWLREEGRGMVAEFGQAPRDKGGSGAYVVFLKKPAAR